METCTRLYQVSHQESSSITPLYIHWMGIFQTGENISDDKNYSEEGEMIMAMIVTLPERQIEFIDTITNPIKTFTNYTE